MPGDVSRKNGKKGGRPKGSVSLQKQIQKQIRDLIAERVSKESEGILQSLLDAGRGIYQQVEHQGTIKVYKKPPNVEALKYLLDQVIGKPMQPVELDADVNLTNLQDFIYAAYEKTTGKGRGDS